MNTPIVIRQSFRTLLSSVLLLSLMAHGLPAAGYPDYNSNPLPADRSGMESNAREIAARIQSGWNIGNTLEAIGGETAWGNPKVSPELISLVKQSGFDAVRIPVSWNQYADPETAEINASWLNRIKEVVQYCIDEDIYVILNIHWDGGWLENNVSVEKQESVNARQKALWEQIATHLRDFDGRLLFASANEPHAENAGEMAVLLSYHQTFVDAVRSTGGRNAYRVLAVQGPSTDIEKTDNLMDSLPVDTVPDRMMVEVHFYTPYNFTLMTEDQSWGKQAYYWGQDFHSASDPDHNATWGEEDELDRLFGLMKSKFVDKGIPVLVGEYSAMRRSDLTGDSLQLHLASRAHYHDYIVERCNALGLLPFFWDNGGLNNHSSGIFDRHKNTVFDTPTLNAVTRVETPQYWKKIVEASRIRPSIEIHPEGEVDLTVPGSPGQSFRIERSESLAPGSWTVLADQVSGSSDPFHLVDPAGPGSRFYRVVFLP